jgi:HK97 family phage major capsid protein
MDRDDLVDITDFDVVAWIKNEMRMMLNEELARAILFGDGRSTASDDKINEQNIRPIWTDHELFTINKKVEFAANATEDDKAKAIIKAAVKARKDYRGAGNPTCFMTEDMLTDMLLLEDSMGYRLYKSEAEIASAMRVSKIVTVPVMENLTRSVTVGQTTETRTLQAIIVNLSDYQVGTDRGGEINSFEQFDIDYNQEKFLIETRCSGALVTPYSAIVIESVQAS